MRLALGLLIALAPVAASAAAIGDASFETVPMPTGGFAYQVTGSSWNFLSDSGISSDGGPFYTGSAPAGTQAAFIQSGVNGQGQSAQGQITQTLTGLSVGTTYDFTYFAAARAGFTGDAIDVSFAGQDLGTVTPVTANFVLETTQSFVATSTTGLLSFLGGVSPTDYDSAIDSVSINSSATVPEPASLVMLGAGLIGFSMVRRKQA